VGYLVKTTPIPAIKAALLDVLADGSAMSPAVARHVVRYGRPVSALSPLTLREKQVVEASHRAGPELQADSRLVGHVG
jgi:DNA-binding NarL/FixJ family response regulator